MHICRHNKERGAAAAAFFVRSKCGKPAPASASAPARLLPMPQTHSRPLDQLATHKWQLATGSNWLPDSLQSMRQGICPAIFGMFTQCTKCKTKRFIEWQWKVAAAEAESRMLFPLQRMGISCQHNCRACNSRVACQYTWHINTLLPGISLPQAGTERGRQADRQRQQLLCSWFFVYWGHLNGISANNLLLPTPGGDAAAGHATK